MNTKKLTIAALGTLLLGAPLIASAVVIDFDSQGLNGPDTFAAAGPAQTHNFNYGVSDVMTLNGGVVLTNTTALPANQTSLYGTAYFGSGLSNPLQIDFTSPIQNFFLDVYNGWITDINFQVYDNAGNSQVFTLAPNLSSGQTQIGFAATGTTVWVQSLVPPTEWDFFIDNIHFNEQLPTGPVPEPASALLLGAGLVGAMLVRRRAKK